MNRDVIPVAELNLPFTTVGKFSWELDPNEVVQISRKSCSDTPNFHIHLGRKGDDTVPLTSTPQIVDPVNVPLPESPGVSWESKNIHKSSSQLEVINKQPSSFTSPISIEDKPVNHSNTAFATDVVLDLNVLFSNVNAGDISAPALIEANPIVPVPVPQNLHGIDVGVGTVPQTQPIPVVLGPVNLPAAINLPLDNNNNNDSSEDETDNIMTDSVIPPPSFSGKAAQDPSD